MVQVLKDNKHDNTFIGILEELSPDKLSSWEKNQASKLRVEDDLIITSGSYDESIILEEQDVDHSRITYSSMREEES